MQTQEMIEIERVPAYREAMTLAGKVLAFSGEIKITDEATNAKAADCVLKIAEARKGLEKARKFFTAPLNEQVKKINALFKPRDEQLAEADSLVALAMLEYKQKKDEAAEKVLKAQEEQYKKEKEEARKLALPDPPRPTPMVAAPAVVVGTVGQAQFRKIWTFEVESFAEVPNELKTLNEVAVRQKIRDGIRSIPGIRIFEKDTLVRG